MRDTLAEFCRGKLHEQIAWFRGLVTWLFTSGGLLFLCICTVLHACFAKPFFERIPNSTVEEAYVHVHKIANELEMYANDVQLALNCDARGMDLVRTTPILVPLKLRLRVIFLRMHRRWLHYTKSYQPGGATCIPELSEEQRLHWASTPAETVFVESYFGVLTDTLKVSGPSVHPLRGAMVAAARHNDVFDVPML